MISSGTVDSVTISRSGEITTQNLRIKAAPALSFNTSHTQAVRFVVSVALPPL